MSSQVIRNDAMMASNAFLLSTATIKGTNQYVIGTDMLMWDESNSYSITQIVPTFGQVINGSGNTPATFRCGNSGLPVFDFGLIFSCFSSMARASVELGTGIPIETTVTSVPGIDVVWFGNHGVLFSLRNNLLVQIASNQAQCACRNEKVPVSSFIDSRRFVLTRSDTHFALDTEGGEGVCTFQIPVSIKRSFPFLFTETPAEPAQNFISVLDEASPLGAMIAGASTAYNVQEIVEQYKMQATLDSVVVRSDLICTPTQRYTDPGTFLGSICYTDKHDIALAVNLRNNLFVHRPWFQGDTDVEDSLQVAPSPKFSEFFNAKEECERIMRFAKTVTCRPLSAAKFDMVVFEAVKTAFYEMKLRRLPLASCLGKIVIPESNLIPGLESTVGENVYCIVPVGALGDNVIILNHDGSFGVIRNETWCADEYFYDITEVVS